MPRAGTEQLDTPFEDLRSTPTARLPYQRNVLLRSYLLQRSTGHVIVYNSPGISAAADALEDVGGATRLLINHAHEAMYGKPSIDVPTFVHHLDRPEVERSMPVADEFGHRQMIDDDLEVIPTPGHTPGTTSYLWDSGQHRFLFTGDFIWIERGEWNAVVLDPALRTDYLDSLAIVRELDFDVLVPWGATDDGPPVARTDRKDARSRIDNIVRRVRQGGDR